MYFSPEYCGFTSKWVWGLITISIVIVRPGEAKNPIQLSDNRSLVGNADFAENEIQRDFYIQGEYLGVIQNPDGVALPIAAQVMAMGGNGRFRATLLWRGLPGDGWDKKRKLEIPGIATRFSADFSGDGFNFSIDSSGKTLQGAGASGASITMDKVVRHSSTEGLPAPPEAVVLFNGDNTDAWVDGQKDGSNCLMAGTKTKRTFGDMFIHMEYRTPFTPEVKYGDRGNSGIYIQSRYECQIYDSFSQQRPLNEQDYDGYGIYPDGGGGAIYKIAAPDVNMTYPPLSWQTFDIRFTAAKYEGGRLLKNPVISVWHNGIQVHTNLQLSQSTVAAPLKPGPDNEPLFLQGHNSNVVFRNIWIVAGSDYPFPDTGRVHLAWETCKVPDANNALLECGFSKLSNTNAGPVIVTAQGIKITAAGPHCVSLYALNGTCAFFKTGRGQREYILPDIAESGVYFIVIKTLTGINKKKIFLSSSLR